jgi:hypothetical protein
MGHSPLETVQQLIAVLQQNSSLPTMQILAILTKIRQVLSTESAISNENLEQLLTETNLTSILQQILNPQNVEEFKYLRLEAAWIMDNIAFWDSEVIALLLTDELVQTVNGVLIS